MKVNIHLQTMYQHKVDVDMLNAIKSMLADVSSVSPSSGLCLNLTNGKDSCVRLRTNFLSITCCAIKGKEIR